MGQHWAAQNRKFGIEIEFVAPVNATMIVRALQNAGIDVGAESYNHQLRNRWKLTTDASINTRNYGHELVSPPLNGRREAKQQIETVCAVLSDLGATVNRTCGLHVHVDGRRMNVRSAARLMRSYVNAQPAIDKLVSASRRGPYTNYCGNVSRRNLEELESYANVLTATSAYGLREIVRGWNRYQKLNLCAYVRHGTVEFRQHQGTLNAKKIWAWIQLCRWMVQAAIENDEPVARTSSVSDLLDALEHPMQLVRRYLTRREAALA